MGKIEPIRLRQIKSRTEVSFTTEDIEEKVRKAQSYLTFQVAADCLPFVPFREGTLRQSVWFPAGVEEGIIEWNAPYAHKMYEGFDEDGRRFHYWTPGTGDHWLERARDAHQADWTRGVASIMREGGR